MSDQFKGDNAALCESIDAMLALNVAGALTPRVPAMAVQLLDAASSRLARSEGPHPESGEALPVVDRILADLDGIIKGVRSGSYSVSDIDSLLCRTIREAEAFKAAARPSPGVSREEVARVEICDVCNKPILADQARATVNGPDIGADFDGPTDVHDACVHALPADTSSEEAAEEVYRAMQWAATRSEGKAPPAWVERGNSHAQEEARRAAEAILALLSRGEG